MVRNKVYIGGYQIISPLGYTSLDNFNAVVDQKTAVKPIDIEGLNQPLAATFNRELLDSIFKEHGISEKFTFLEKLMILSLKKMWVNQQLEITSKTLLIVATTKGNIDVLDQQSRFYHQPERAYLSVLAKQIAKYFEFDNDPVVLSNACISGSLAIAIAKDLISRNVYEDVVIVAGDLVTKFVLSGFQSFQALSDELCKPYSINRKGINLGEAVASMWLSKNKPLTAELPIHVLGGASRNDANHISGPSRTGEGLFLSANAAFQEAKIPKKSIDFIAAHGTATLYNDEMEAIAFNRLGLEDTPMHSLKANYGHTLGAAGLLETILGIESLKHNTLLPSKGFDSLGVTQAVNVVKEPVAKDLQCFLKTSSGFGGCNAAIILKKTL